MDQKHAYLIVKVTKVYQNVETNCVCMQPPRVQVPCFRSAHETLEREGFCPPGDSNSHVNQISGIDTWSSVLYNASLQGMKKGWGMVHFSLVPLKYSFFVNDKKKILQIVTVNRCPKEKCRKKIILIILNNKTHKYNASVSNTTPFEQIWSTSQKLL